MNLKNKVLAYDLACRLKSEVYKNLESYLIETFCFENWQYKEVEVSYKSDFSSLEDSKNLKKVFILELLVPENFKILEESEPFRQFSDGICQNFIFEDPTGQKIELVFEQYFCNIGYTDETEDPKESCEISFRKSIVSWIKLNFILGKFEIKFETEIPKDKIKNFFFNELTSLKINYDIQENSIINEKYKSNSDILKLVQKELLPAELKDIFNFQGEQELNGMKIIVSIKTSLKNKEYCCNFSNDLIWVQYRNLKYEKSEIKISIQKFLSDEFFENEKTEKILFNEIYKSRDIQYTALEIFDKLEKKI